MQKTRRWITDNSSKNVVHRGYWRNFQEKKTGKRLTEHFTAKYLGNRKHRPKDWKQQTKAREHWTESDHWGWTGTRLGRPDTNTSLRAREMGLTQSSIVQIIHHDDAGLKCFLVYQNTCLLWLQ